MKFKTSAFFIFLLILFNCEVRFEDDTRILIKGQTLDEQGSPIPDAEVSVFTRRRTGSFFVPGPQGTDEFLLGRNFSSNDGNFSVTSLFDKDDDFSIEIDAGDYYSKYVYRTTTVNYTPDDLIFDLDTVELIRLGQVNYSITRTSGDGNSIQFSFKFKDAICVEVYDAGELALNEGFCFEDRTETGSLNDNRPDVEQSFFAPLNSTIEFTYSINGEPEVTETFILTDSTYAFNFNY
ncbi:hypothetical protein [Winogradskyella sp. A3E31]|uniref:hypothetical protein n=1 Tax=Winogradskyella sp. A3E31 TaxID=3349637 RepID=UPI00398B1006